MLLFLSIVGVFLSVILISFHAKKFGATLFLGLFFFTVSMYAVSQYILLYSGSVFFVTLFLIHFSVFASLPYLIGPMLYFYVRSVLYDTLRLKRSDSLHFFPHAAGFPGIRSSKPFSFVRKNYGCHSHL